MYIVQIRGTGFVLALERATRFGTGGPGTTGGMFISLIWDSCKLCSSSSSYGDRIGRSAERAPFERALY